MSERKMGPPTIVVAGGTGYLGRAVCELLLSQGNRVIVVSRTPQNATRLAHNNISYQGYDALASFSDVRAVINLCGQNIAAQRWSKKRKAALLDSRITPTELLGKAIRNHWLDCNTYIGMSAIGYYKDDSNKKLAEYAPTGVGFAAQLCKALEESIEQSVPNKVRRVVLRSGVVIGSPEKGSYLAKIWPLYQRRLGGKIADGHHWFSWIYREDIASMIVYALQSQHMSGVINATSPNATTYAELHNNLRGLSGKQQLLPMPKWLVKLMFGELSTLLLASHRVVPSKALQDGFEFDQPSLSMALKKALFSTPTSISNEA